MRKKMIFSASFQGRVVQPSNDSDTSEREVRSFSEFDDSITERDRKEFMTPTIIKQTLIEMKRRPNIRFLRLIKSARSVTSQLRSIDDITNLKKLLIKELSFMLSEYSEMLNSNASLQLNTYFRINSVIPQASDAARQLSRVMIKCTKIKKSTGYLPPNNQRDLSRTMDAFIQMVINTLTQGVNVLTPILNEATE